MKRLRNIGRLFTGTPAGVVEDASVIIDGEEIAWCGKQRDEPRELMESVADEHDCAGGLVTAGLIDANTGYHLQREGEIEATRLLARLGTRPDLPRIEVTFLAAHALPPDRWARMGAYAKQVADWCDDAYMAGARFCDVFCDRGYFSVAQSRAIL